MSQKSALITGGTGFIGQALCRKLSDEGYRLTVLTRNKTRAEGLFDHEVTCVESLDDIDSGHGFDVVINLAGETIAQRWTEAAKARILKSRLETTQALNTLFARLETKPKLYIGGSAIGWYGTDAHAIFCEKSRVVPEQGSFAQDLCHQWEAETLKAKPLGIRTVVLRTGVVLEKDGGTLAKLYAPFFMGLGGPIGHGQQWFSWIHRDDLIGIMMYIMEHDDIEGAVNGTAPKPVTNKAFSVALGRAMRRPAFFPMPAFVLNILFGAMAEEIMLQGQHVVPRKICEAGYRYQYSDIESALKTIV